MPENIFSHYKDPETITINGASWRKVSHSFRDHSFRRPNSVKDGAASVGKAGVKHAPDIAGSTATFAALAAILGGSSIFVLSAPATLVMGTAALGWLAFSKTYSNREQAHNDMAKHVYSLIDDVPPVDNFFEMSNPKTMDKVYSAALYLMQEGPHQFSKMKEKLESAKRKFDELVSSCKRTMEEAQKEGDYHKFQRALSIWQNAERKDGAIWEFMRRLVHTGNYLQCGAVIHAYIAYKQSERKIYSNRDPIKRFKIVKECRALLEPIEPLKTVLPRNTQEILDYLDASLDDTNVQF